MRPSPRIHLARGGAGRRRRSRAWTVVGLQAHTLSRLTRLISLIGIWATVGPRAAAVYLTGRSGAIGPEIFGPRSQTFKALSGWLNASLTAVPSKPQCAMQLSQRGFLPTPYLSHSVSSMRER